MVEGEAALETAGYFWMSFLPGAPFCEGFDRWEIVARGEVFEEQVGEWRGGFAYDYAWMACRFNSLLCVRGGARSWRGANLRSLDLRWRCRTAGSRPGLAVCAVDWFEDGLLQVHGVEALDARLVAAQTGRVWVEVPQVCEDAALFEVEAVRLGGLERGESRRGEIAYGLEGFHCSVACAGGDEGGCGCSAVEGEVE